MSAELTTILTSATPLLERGAVPFAIFVLGIPPLTAYLLFVFGSSLPVLPLLLFWNYLYEKVAEKSRLLSRFFAWLFERTRTKHKDRFEVWKDLALFLFVAIPLPVNGVWSGTVLAFVFGVPIKKAAAMIFLGNATYGLIVLLLSKGISFI